MKVTKLITEFMHFDRTPHQLHWTHIWFDGVSLIFRWVLTGLLAERLGVWLFVFLTTVNFVSALNWRRISATGCQYTPFLHLHARQSQALSLGQNLSLTPTDANSDSALNQKAYF